MPSKQVLYRPLDNGLPRYFLPMLRDKDRTAKFDDAIRGAIERFRESTGGARAPTVVDLGAGTGLLSALALKHGAKHVTLVDVNADVLGMATAALDSAGWREGTHFEVVVGSFSSMPGAERYAPDKTFDMLVSELLGTLTTSESMHAYLPDAIPYVAETPGYGRIVVPRRAAQKLSLYRIDVVEDGADACVRVPHANSIPAWKVDEEDEVRFATTNELQLYGLHQKPFERIHSAVIRVDSFGGETPEGVGVEILRDYRFRVPDDVGEQQHFFVLEWECELFGEIVLQNTLPGYAACADSAVDRAAAWGVALARCDALAAYPGSKLKFCVAYPRRPRAGPGWPSICPAAFDLNDDDEDEEDHEAAKRQRTGAGAGAGSSA